MLKKNKEKTNYFVLGLVYACLFIGVNYIFDIIGISNILLRAVFFLQKLILTPWWTVVLICVKEIITFAGVSFLVTVFLNKLSLQNARESIRVATIIYLIYIFYISIVQRGFFNELSSLPDLAQALLPGFFVPVFSFYLFGRLLNK